MQYPMPEVDESRQPPFEIGLEPWAAATAEELHRQFGDDVELTVGALPYPPGDWRIQATLTLVPHHDAEGDARRGDAHLRALRAVVGRDLLRRRTPILPLTITD